jgi:hypothetical protein|tara:strand:+ start:120 stop:419 length:300 start_codon:yes stop_codon:yes gene_type:complete
MWEMIERMATDRLWIYTALVGSLFGLAFSTYFKSTRIGLWMYGKFDTFADYLVERWGLTWLKQPDDAWRKKYPYVTKKIDELEERLEQIEVSKQFKKKK